MTPRSSAGPVFARAVTSRCQPFPSGSAMTNGSRQCSSVHGAGPPRVSYQRGSARTKGFRSSFTQCNRSVEVADLLDQRSVRRLGGAGVEHEPGAVGGFGDRSGPDGGLVEFPWVAVDERVGDLFPMDEVG